MRWFSVLVLWVCTSGDTGLEGQSRRISPGSSSLLLCRRLSLGGLLLVAVDHHNAYEGADHGGTQEGQNDGNADGPNTRREEVMEGVAGVDKGLSYELEVIVKFRFPEYIPSTASKLCSKGRLRLRPRAWRNRQVGPARQWSAYVT